FDDIMANNIYPLLENALDDLNEHQIMAVYLMIVTYYIENGRSLMGYLPNDHLRITVHIHQDTQCQPIITYIDHYIKDWIKDFDFDMKNISIDYMTDQGNYLLTNVNYGDTDILVSLSQCAGLDPELPVGGIIIPEEFIPYNIDSRTIKISEMYTVKNDLQFHLGHLLDSPQHMNAVYYINRHYKSYNP